MDQRNSKWRGSSSWSGFLPLRTSLCPLTVDGAEGAPMGAEGRYLVSSSLAAPASSAHPKTQTSLFFLSVLKVYPISYQIFLNSSLDKAWGDLGLHIFLSGLRFSLSCSINCLRFFLWFSNYTKSRVRIQTVLKCVVWGLAIEIWCLD